MKVSGVTIVTPSKVPHHIDIALFVSSWDVTQARPDSCHLHLIPGEKGEITQGERERGREGERITSHSKLVLPPTFTSCRERERERERERRSGRLAGTTHKS